MGAIRQLIERLTGPMTSLGRGVLMLGLVSWLISAVLGWKEFAVVAGVCLAGVIAAAMFTLGRTQLDVHVSVAPTRVKAGDTAVAEFIVTNTASRRMLPVRLEIPISNAVAVIAVPMLTAGEIFEETIIIPTTRRCVVPIGPTRSVRGDPLALMRREVVWDEVHELFVHPKVSNLRGISSGWLRDLEGQPTNDRSPNDVAFHTLREYVPGDDRRHVHWRTSARIDKLMVRQFIDNRRSHLGIVIDTNPASYLDADEFELAVSMAASLGLRAIDDGQEVTCVAGTAGVNTHTGQVMLDGLSRVELGVPAIGLHETTMRAAPMMPAASVVALVTGSSPTPDDVSLAGRRFGLDVQLVIIRARFDEPASLIRSPQSITVAADTLDDFTRALWSVAGTR